MSFHYLKCNNNTVLTETSNHLNCNEFNDILANLELSNLKGRKPLYLLKYHNETYVLRNYYHGGIFGNLFKYSYWEKRARSFEEYKLTVNLFNKGLPVLKPLFSYKTNGMFYKQSISTKLLENSKDLFAIDSLKDEIVESVLKTIELFLNNGLYHPDLNIKNILFNEVDKKIFLIDFDNAKLKNNSIIRKERIKIYKRLFRSFDKMGKIEVLKNFNFEKFPEYIEKSYKEYLKISKFRSLWWKFSKK